MPQLIERKNNSMKRVALASALAFGLAAAITPAVASASPSDPTAGDTIVYEYFSDTASNNGSTWFDANNEIKQITETYLPSRAPDSAAFYGTQRVVSRSTYQSVASNFQTNGYFAGCRITVNGTVVSANHATGKYAVASCG